MNLELFGCVFCFARPVCLGDVGVEGSGNRSIAQGRVLVVEVLCVVAAFGWWLAGRGIVWRQRQEERKGLGWGTPRFVRRLNEESFGSRHA